MASVTLDRLYIHDYSDPDDYDTFAYAAMDETSRRIGRVRRLSGGRLRLTTAPGPEARYNVEFVNLTATEVQAIRGRAGSHVIVRDQRGRLIYGVYFDVDVEDRPERELFNVSITVDTVTGTVEVL